MPENLEEDNSFGKNYFSVLLSDAPFYDEKYKEEFNLVLSLLTPKPGDKILEMGCGKGQLGLFLLDKEKKCEVTFSDISKEAGIYLSGNKFVQSSMVKTPFLDNSFDKIYSKYNKSCGRHRQRD